MGPKDKKSKEECSPFDHCMKMKKFAPEKDKNRPKHKPNIPSGGEMPEEEEVPKGKQSHINPRMMGSPGSAAR